MTSLRLALARIGEPKIYPFGVRGSFGGRTPHSLLTAIAGLNDAGIGSWKKVGIALSSENSEVSDKAQGITTDGSAWYVCSNGGKMVVKYGNDAKRLKTYVPDAQRVLEIWPGSRDGDPHFGAPAYHDGWIYVPVQDPPGVWRFSVDGATQEWHHPSELPGSGLFPWCDIHPVTGILYTCAYDVPQCLRAFSRDDLTYLPAHDIQLGKTSIYLDRIQGGVFTARGHLILTRCSYNAVFCFSFLNGHCFGAQNLESEIDSECEGVTVRNWQFSGRPTQVHILELDNDIKDDFYVHSFQVPDVTTL
jgi:hypothetical protein